MMMMGVYLRKKGIAKDGFGKQLAGLITTVILPCAIIKYMSVEATTEQLKIGLFIILLGTVTAICIFFIGHTVYRLNGKTALGRVMWAGTLGTNVSLFGYPVVEALFGAEGMFFYNLMLIPIRIITYTMMDFVMVSDERFDELKTFKLKNLYSPLLLYLFIGMAIGFFHIHLPVVLTSTINTVAGALTPMGMMLCGFTIADADWKTLFKDKWIYIFCCVKFIACPVVAIIVAKLMGANPMQAQLLILFSCFPIGSVVNSFAVKNDCVPVQASAYTAFTTLVSLGIVPIAVVISSHLFV